MCSPRIYPPGGGPGLLPHSSFIRRAAPPQSHLTKPKEGGHMERKKLLTYPLTPSAPHARLVQ
jgi:hypothetical protein